ncbi:hypothetical protein [Campylobacter upsaliensis]|uniref:hypothetical protein n=1 Tax=Campylobacter upsaliensis TaxID=28080 RepID=UPI00214A2B6F|nr:hypothetical protein [Campylobacter upsaliensis]MCR2098752.1 hypothetical protein [Campylobacter upsaliensis]
MNMIEKTIEDGKSFYKDFKNQIAKSKENIKNNYIKVDETNLGDNNFFAFLNEWLKDLLKIKEEDKLIDELKKNEALTKEKLQLILKDQLKEYLKLDKEILKEKGLEHLDYDKANKLLDNENFMEFTHELIDDKIKKLNKFAKTLQEKGKDSTQITQTLQKQDLSIKTKDIQNLSAKTSNDIKNTQKIINDGVKIAKATLLKR